MEMIHLTWFECIQLLVIAIAALFVRPMVIGARRSEAEARDARMRDGEEPNGALQHSSTLSGHATKP